MSFRKERIHEQYQIPMSKIKDEAIRMDKQRASYYNYYTSQKWGEISNYDLTVNSSILGIDGTVDLIRKAVDLRETTGTKPESAE